MRTSFLLELVYFVVVIFMGAFSHDLMMPFNVALLVDVVESGKTGGVPSICPISGGSGVGREGILSLIPVVLKIYRKIV